ncbi:chitin-binding domain-containing protein [Pseudomonas sp. RA_5y_Pfl1_P24]|uniref:chitin-binding domain-containing protein n=1 Tax=unclassified Pseudomonas TaxID=196821 RepID=UPI00403F498D
MNGSRVTLKNNAVYKTVLGFIIAVSLGACTTEPPESREPACTKAGYFKSTDRVGGYYRCVWSAQSNRWLQFPYTCPAGHEFSEQLQRCVRP